MIYLAKMSEVSSQPTRVCVEDVMDRATANPMKMMADLRFSFGISAKTLPGIVTVTVK